MRILGIDYGQAKVGLAIADAGLAEPYKVIRYKSPAEIEEKIADVVNSQGIEKVIVGVSEGKMAEESANFSSVLASLLNVPVETYDETLSTHEAQSLSIAAGIGPKRRKEMEDAYAAAIILQSYLDSSQ